MSMIRFNMKAFFFDRKAVTDMVDKSAKKGLGYFGGVVRKIAKRSIVEAKNWFDHSRAGNPPKSHVGTLKRMIYYAWDPDHRSVVIGPELFSPMSGAPENLEHGGTAFIRRKKRVVRIAKRPFMQPAFEHELEKLPLYVSGSLRGSNNA